MGPWGWKWLGIIAPGGGGCGGMHCCWGIGMPGGSGPFIFMGGLIVPGGTLPGGGTLFIIGGLKNLFCGGPWVN